MNHRVWRWLGVLAVTVVAAGPVRAETGGSSDNLLELTARGGPAVALSLGVSPIHLELIPPPETTPGTTAAESRVLGDRDLRGRAVSFDITLKWPTAELPIEPYLVLGPALFVDPLQELSSPIGIPADPVLRLGAKAGAGFNWRLSKDATLFGSYDVTTTTADRFGYPSPKTPAAGTSTGYDLLYGVRFRY
jgi:hypothetical protein